MTSSITPTTVKASPSGEPFVQIVARNSAAMLAGQILIKILALAFSVYVVRRLGDTNFGRYSAALAYVAIFAIFTDLGTSTLSVREMARRGENIAWMVPNIMALRALLSVVVIVVITVLAWLLNKTPDMVLGIFVASCGMLLYAFQGPLDSTLIASERLDFSSAIALLNQVVFVVLGTILLLVGAGYIGLLLASLVGVLAMGLASAYVARRVLKLHFERPHPLRWWHILRASFPFSILMATDVLGRRFDTVFMSFVLVDAAIGWYNVPFNLVFMMLLLAQSLALAIYPSLIKQYDSGRGSIQDTAQRALRYLLLVSLPLAVGGMLLASRIIILLYHQQFAPAIPAMQILVWGLPAMFLLEMTGRISMTLHREKLLARVSILNLLIGIILSVILIPRLGIIGAAIAMVSNQWLRVFMESLIIGPALLYKGNVAPLLRVIGAGAVMGGAVWLSGNNSSLAAINDKIGLLLIICLGAVVYSAAAFLLGAISSGETRYMVRIIRRRLGQLG
jgi:O-antigen/teichoic acid export membrane protein